MQREIIVPQGGEVCAALWRVNGFDDVSEKIMYLTDHCAGLKNRTGLVFRDKDACACIEYEVRRSKNNLFLWCRPRMNAALHSKSMGNPVQTCSKVGYFTRRDACSSTTFDNDTGFSGFYHVTKHAANQPVILSSPCHTGTCSLGQSV